MFDGLYRIVNIYDSALIPIYFEYNQGNSAVAQSLSTFLSATIYPVPITNNYFSIHMMASRDLHYEYKLTDLNGNVMMEEIFDSGLNEEIVFSTEIDPGIYLPYNMFVNTFTFEDGSTLVIQTMRQTQ